MIIGIDPGLKGAIAYIDIAAGMVGIMDMPVIVTERPGKKKGGKRAYHTGVDVKSLYGALREAEGAPIMIEKVSVFVGAANTSSETFGRAVGRIEAVALLSSEVVDYVLPMVWKRYYGLIHGTKDDSRALASNLFKNGAHFFKRKKDDGRAEALLIAAYWLENKGITIPWEKLGVNTAFGKKH